jgi:hypothetical protein
LSVNMEKDWGEAAARIEATEPGENGYVRVPLRRGAAWSNYELRFTPAVETAAIVDTWGFVPNNVFEADGKDAVLRCLQYAEGRGMAPKEE